MIITQFAIEWFAGINYIILKSQMPILLLRQSLKWYNLCLKIIESQNSVIPKCMVVKMKVVFRYLVLINRDDNVVLSMQVDSTVLEISTLGSQTNATEFKRVINSASGRHNSGSEYENGIDYAYSTIFPVSEVY